MIVGRQGRISPVLPIPPLVRLSDMTAYPMATAEDDAPSDILVCSSQLSLRNLS